MTNDQAIRRFYHLAEIQDFPAAAACFTEDGTFTDESVGVTYRGPDIMTPGVVFAAAFPDAHRELFRFFVTGDVVIVELALQRDTHRAAAPAHGSHSSDWQAGECAVL